MYVCIFVCMYIMYAYVHVRMCIIYICERMYIHNTRTYIQIKFVCMYICAYIMYVCTHVWLYVCTFIHIRKYAMIEMIMVVEKLSRREYVPLKTGEKYSRGNLSGRKVSGGKVSSRNCPFPCSLYMYAGAYIP